MLSLIIAAAVANAPEAVRPVATASPAMATVRIMRAAEIRIDRLAATDESVLRRTLVREGDGALRTASLVEFY